MTHHNVVSTHASRLKTPAEMVNKHSLHRSAASMNAFCSTFISALVIYLTDVHENASINHDAFKFITTFTNKVLPRRDVTILACYAVLLRSYN